MAVGPRIRTRAPAPSSIHVQHVPLESFHKTILGVFMDPSRVLEGGVLGQFVFPPGVAVDSVIDEINAGVEIFQDMALRQIVDVDFNTNADALTMPPNMWGRPTEAMVFFMADGDFRYLIVNVRDARVGVLAFSTTGEAVSGVILGH